MRISITKSLEHGFKRFFFFLSRVYLRKGRGDFGVIDPRRIEKVLFIRPEKLGDMVISLPVFHNLKKMHPHLQLFTICSPRNVAVIRDNRNIAANFLYTKNILHDLAMIRRVRRLGADVVVDMVGDDSVTSLFLTQYASPGARRIGLGKRRHRLYYDFNYEYRTEDEAHVIDNTLKLLTAFGIATDDAERYVPPTIPETSRRTAERFITSLDGQAPGGIIGINISAGRPTRVWPEGKTHDLIRRLLAVYPTCRIVISSDPQDRARAETMTEPYGKRVDPVPPGLGLLDVAAIISRMRMLVTPDTSLVHIARSFQVPVVGLYTRFQKNFKLWRPYGQKTGAVISGNDYNIFDITVDEVVNAAVTLSPPEKKP